MEAWPERILSEQAWDGCNPIAYDSCTVQLTPEEKAEVRDGLRIFQTHGLDGPLANRHRFPLPKLSSKLHSLAKELHEGRGYGQIKGLDLNEYCLEDRVIVFLGISAHIAETRARQDDAGNMIAHVHNIKQAHANFGESPAKYSKDNAPFHTDPLCDILAFMLQGKAEKGGALNIASCSTIYNKLKRSRPDLLALLTKPDWSLDSHSKTIPCQSRPLLFYHANHLVMDFARQALLGREGLPWTQGLKHISQKQIEALDEVEALAAASQVTLDMEPGDLTFINNHAVLHSRTAFEDSERHVRHLLRLWLRNKDMAWELPPELASANATLYDSAGLTQRWELTPMPVFPIPWNQWSSSP